MREYIHAADAARLSVDIIEDQQYENENIILTGTERLKRIELVTMINEIMGNKIKINYSKETHYEGHYQLTPYSFRPRVAEKLLLNTYHDLGQGLLDTIYDIYKELYKDNPKKLSKISIREPNK